MMKNAKFANVIGCLSVSCSMAIWVLLCLKIVIRHLPEKFDLPVNGWIMVWGAALLLALIAAKFGSRWWALAAILPVITCVIAIGVVASFPF